MKTKLLKLQNMFSLDKFVVKGVCWTLFLGENGKTIIIVFEQQFLDALRFGGFQFHVYSCVIGSGLVSLMCTLFVFTLFAFILGGDKGKKGILFW